MADASDARLPQNAPISATALPRDRLSLLPNELLDTIYSLVFQFEDGPWTLNVKKRLNSSWDRPDCDRDPVPSILALPRDRRYEARRLQTNNNLCWPDNVEEAFFRALDWGHRNKAPSLNELITKIIYELTGVCTNRKQVSSHIQVLRGWTRDMESSSERVLRDIRDYLSEIQNSNIHDDDDVSRMFHIVEDELPNELGILMGALMEESKMAEHVSLRPMLNFGFSPVITPNAEIFRLLSSTASNPNGCYQFFLSTHTLSTHALANDILLSPTLINRFHRTRSLAVLASNLVYDMGDNIKAVFAFDNQNTGFSIKRVRLTFIEGYMQFPFIRQLAPGLPPLPNLRELIIELWPRNPTGENKEDRSCGDQTIDLLEALSEMKARVVIKQLIFWRPLAR